jgi:Na+-driven multidrug efflux pump
VGLAVGKRESSKSQKGASSVEFFAVGHQFLCHLFMLLCQNNMLLCESGLAMQVFTFIGVSVTNVLASNSASAPAISDTEKQRRIVLGQKLQSYALYLAVCCGIVCTGTCLAFGESLLRLMGAGDPTIPHALPYLRIRSLSAPAMMVMNACQGAFLGQQNTLTPLTIFVVAAACNALLDAGLVLGLGWGLPGAATATAVSQVRECGAGYFGLVLVIQAFSLYALAHAVQCNAVPGAVAFCTAAPLNHVCVKLRPRSA